MSISKFITLEGGEGVGKSTNMAFIIQYLQNKHIPVLQTREPGGTPVAEKIREILLAEHDESITGHTELLMVFAARAQHLNHVIKPALKKGIWVVSDRFTDATYAYQGGGRNMDITQIAWLENMIQGDFRPDLTLLLDAPIEIGMQRMNDRGKPDRFESEQITFFKQVRNYYLLQAKHHPERVNTINANQSLGKVQNEIAAALENLLTCCGNGSLAL